MRGCSAGQHLVLWRRLVGIVLTILVLQAGSAWGALRHHHGTNVSQPAPTLQDELLENFIVIPEHKLLFCYVEKVGCANFNELFRRLRSRYDPTQMNFPRWGKNSPMAHNLTKQDLEKMMVDETWHKAIFFRDPLERFISAFMSKCGNVDPDGKRRCMEQFGVEELNFTEAVAYIAEKMLKAPVPGTAVDDREFNRHWQRMGRFCGGLRNTLQFYDTVEELDIRTSHRMVQMLLLKVGANPFNVHGFNMLFPPAEDGGQDTWSRSRGYFRSHVTNSAVQLNSVLTSNQSWLRRVLRRHYQSDYDLFNIAARRNYTPSTSQFHVYQERWPLLGFDGIDA